MKAKNCLLVSLLIVPLFVCSGGSLLYLSSNKNKISISPLVNKSGGDISTYEKPTSSTGYTLSDYTGRFTINKGSVYGPYSSGVGSFNFTISITYNGFKKLPECQYSLIETRYEYNGVTWTSQERSSIDAITSNQKTMSYTFNIFGLDSSIQKVNLDYGIYSPTLTAFLVRKSFTFYLYNPVTINPLNYRSIGYANKGSKFYANGEMVEEAYSFKNFRDNLTADRYNKILINEYSFDYDSSEKFTYEKAYLYFDDFNGIFPHLKNDQNGYKNIPLNISTNGVKNTLNFGSGLGVDPTSLESYYPNAGMTNTNYLYIPKNKQKYLQDYKFYICIKNMGFSKLSVDFCVKLICDSFVIGDCNDGDFCIIGGIVH